MSNEIKSPSEISGLTFPSSTNLFTEMHVGEFKAIISLLEKLRLFRLVQKINHIKSKVIGKISVDETDTLPETIDLLDAANEQELTVLLSVLKRMNFNNLDNWYKSWIKKWPYPLVEDYQFESYIKKRIKTPPQVRLLLRTAHLANVDPHKLAKTFNKILCGIYFGDQAIIHIPGDGSEYRKISELTLCNSNLIQSFVRTVLPGMKRADISTEFRNERQGRLVLSFQ